MTEMQTHIAAISPLVVILILMAAMLYIDDKNRKENI
jgi:hypothetical protein